MTPIAKSEAFFFISSVAVVMLSLLTAAVLVLCIKALRDIRGLVRRIETEAEFLFRDMRKKLDDLKNPGLISRIVAQLVSHFFKHKGQK